MGQILADAVTAGVAVGLVPDRAENLLIYRRASPALVAYQFTSGGSFAWWSFRTPSP